MKRNVLGVLAGMLVALVGCGDVDPAGATAPEEALAESESALYPECCSAIPGSGYTEAFCDSVSYSPGRCNAVWSGTACSWNTTNCPVTCCQPKSGSTVPWNYCNTYNISEGRCNAVNSGTTCAWAC
ncbi:solute carrier organic anion transporter [Myxococcus sp. K15C18031901]|uniref:solute carrier organic anion transporter n=1 Tax=Myxococcus dinghuensis TaxID=2906761 RepID=UPI0020A7CC69|nr:solute carrier organic anion transporter [Myxococcus dinghuensis]MCP3102285.1 solute carrier organic anion transporter [Myxococcus dinghuensis]